MEKVKIEVEIELKIAVKPLHVVIQTPNRAAFETSREQIKNALRGAKL